MGKADALSQMTGLETEVNHNKDIVLLKPELFVNALQMGNPEDELLNKIQKSSHLVKETVQKATNKGDKEWTGEDSIFY